jgi:hypothetical protein
MQHNQETLWGQMMRRWQARLMLGALDPRLCEDAGLPVPPPAPPPVPPLVMAWLH